MKTTVHLGCLPIVVEANTTQELVREAWKIARLNMAITQEGADLIEWMPYCENGADGNEYAGFVHLQSGKRIRWGKQKQQNGGDWFVRGKSADSYRGIETWQMDTSNQLPQQAQSSQQSRQQQGQQALQRQQAPAQQAPAQQSQQSDPDQPGPTSQQRLDTMEKYLKDAQAGGWLETAIEKCEPQVDSFTGNFKRMADAMIERFQAKLYVEKPATVDDDLPF
ncbi:MAG: hypothetical protein AAF564_17840 [Bacteroidota bacterium]